MNKSTLILLGLLAAPWILSCSGDIDGFTGKDSSSSNSNIISAGNFSVGFNPASVAVIKFTTLPVGNIVPCTGFDSFTGGLTSTITVTAGDKDNALVSSGTVYIDIQYGNLDQTSCQLQNGECSVQWTGSLDLDNMVFGAATLDPNPTFDCTNNGNGSIDLLNSVTVWTYGIENFYDNNHDGYLSGTEVFTDSDEPYLDLDDNNVYNSAIDDLSSADTDGVHSGPNNVYDGPYCDSTTRIDCGGANLIPIYTKSYLIIAE